VAFRQFALAVIASCNYSDQVAWIFVEVHLLSDDVTFSIPEIIPMSEIEIIWREILTVV